MRCSLSCSRILRAQSLKVRNKVCQKKNCVTKSSIRRGVITRYFLSPISSNRRRTAPILVHISSLSQSDFTSKPIPTNLPRKAAVDSLLVLLQNLKGTAAFLRLWIASMALGVGVLPICRVPERSMRIARIAGRACVGIICIFLISLLQMWKWV